MGIIILFILITAGAFFCIHRFMKDSSIIIFDILLSMVASFFISVIVLVGLMSFDLSKEVTGYKTTPIASLSARNDTGGQFVLGCGTVNETSYYYYYKVVGDNSYQLDKVGAMGVTISERDEPPCVRYARKRCSSKFLRFMIGDEYVSGRPEIVIPKGSIIKKFNPNF
jgi:hypothetical protein